MNCRVDFREPLKQLRILGNSKTFEAQLSYLLRKIMKKLTTLLGTSIFALSGLIVPMTAMAYPQSAEPKAGESLPDSTSTVQPSQKMALYSDCLRVHADVSGADFKQINKFCSCVADQTIQGDSTLSSCATGGGEGGSGGTFGMIGEMAPSIITGVVQGITSNSGKSGGGLLGGKSGGLLDGLGGLLGGGLLGGGGIGDILKGR